MTRLRAGYRFRNVWAVLLSLAIVGTLVVGRSTALGQGERGRFGTWQVAVDAVESPDRLPNFTESERPLRPAGRWVALTLIVTNHDSKPARFRQDDLVLVDGRGREFSPAQDATSAFVIDRDFNFREFQPDLPDRTGVVFDVPRDADALSLSTPDRAFVIALGAAPEATGDASPGGAATPAAIARATEPSSQALEKDAPSAFVTEVAGLRERVSGLETAVAQRNAAAAEAAGRVAALETRVAALERDGARADGAAPTGVPGKGHALSGSITLYTDEYRGVEQPDGTVICWGTGGFSDMEGSLPVVVRNYAGDVIASGRTEEGRRVRDGCQFSFSLAGVPDVDFYQIEVGRRGTMVYAREELAPLWLVMLSLGDREDARNAAWDVVRYVASKTPTPRPTPSPTPEPSRTATATKRAVTIVSHDIYFDPKQLTIPADRDVVIRLPNKGAAPHNFSIDELGIRVDLPPGEADLTTTINASPGTYDFYCNVPGHKEAGMVGTLIVEGSAPTPTATPESARAPGASSIPPRSGRAIGRSSLFDLLPTQADVPAGLRPVQEAERSEAEVVDGLGGTQEAARLLNEWGWAGNAFRDFANTGADAPPSATTYLNVSVHRFADDASADKAFRYFSDLVATGQGLEEFPVESIGDATRGLRGAPDGLPLVVIYVRDGSLMYRIGASASTADGDPVTDAIAVAEKVVQKEGT